jgi:hypothetical protein
MAGCALERSGQEMHEGDVLRPETLRGAGEGVDAGRSVAVVAQDVLEAERDAPPVIDDLDLAVIRPR